MPLRLLRSGFAGQVAAYPHVRHADVQHWEAHLDVLPVLQIRRQLFDLSRPLPPAGPYHDVRERDLTVFDSVNKVPEAPLVNFG
jgi:hypothetical protein